MLRKKARIYWYEKTKQKIGALVTNLQLVVGKKLFREIISKYFQL